MAAILRLRTTVLCAVVLMSSCTTVATSPAASAQAPAAQQGQTMMGGWHYHGAYGQMYFAGKDINLQGTILETNQFVPRPRMMRGRQLIVQTTDAKISVHLGPEWYVREQEVNLKAGERIQVRGKLIGEGSAAFVIASEISKDGQTWVLRDPQGIPFWCALRGPQPAPQSPAEPPQRPVK